MSLQEKIQEKKAEFRSSAPNDVQEAMARAIREFQESNIVDKALKSGDRAPDFTLPNGKGEPVNLNRILSSGPAVVGFYRGR